MTTILAVIGGVAVAFWAVVGALALVGWVGRSVTAAAKAAEGAAEDAHARAVDDEFARIVCAIEGDPDALIEHIRKLYEE